MKTEISMTESEVNDKKIIREALNEFEEKLRKWSDSSKKAYFDDICYAYSTIQLLENKFLSNLRGKVSEEVFESLGLSRNNNGSQSLVIRGGGTFVTQYGRNNE